MNDKKALPADRQERLDQFVINIEFLLISVVQGVALGALATAAINPVTNFKPEYFLYIVSGFLFILNFWSQAIIHTLSFIDWPIDMTHNFLYFLVGLVEVISFSQITNPARWFESICVFFAVAFALYLFDLSLIKKHKYKFEDFPERRTLYKHILEREIFEMRVLLPLGFLYNIVCVILIRLYPTIFIQNHYHILLIALQAVFGFFVLKDSVGIFKTRSQLITNSIGY